MPCATVSDESANELMLRISELMEKEKLYQSS